MVTLDYWLQVGGGRGGGAAAGDDEEETGAAAAGAARGRLVGAMAKKHLVCPGLG